MRHRSMVAIATLLPVLLLPIGSSVATPSSTGAVTVPLSDAGDGHDTVPVFVNGEGPYPFILDTGADGSAVYQWFANKAALEKIPGKEQDLSGQTGSAKVSMYSLRRVSLAGVVAPELEAFALPDRKDNGREAGVLGNDLMDRAVVVFDFSCRRVEVHPKPADVAHIVGHGRSATRTGVDPGTTLLTLPVTVNGARGIAVLDTGSRWTRLTPSFAAIAGIDPASPAFKDAEPIYGTSGHRIIPRAGPVGTFRFGGQTLPDVSAQVVDLPMLQEDFGGKPALLLGADVLGKFRFVYDHAEHKVWFLPTRCRAID